MYVCVCVCVCPLLLQQHYTLNLCPAVSTVILSYSVAVLDSFFTWKTGKYPVKENRTPFTCILSHNVKTWHTVTKNAFSCKLWQSAAGKVLGVLLHMAACLGPSLTFLHLPLFAPTNYLLNQGASYWWKQNSKVASESPFFPMFLDNGDMFSTWLITYHSSICVCIFVYTSAIII